MPHSFPRLSAPSRITDSLQPRRQAHSERATLAYEARASLAANHLPIAMPVPKAPHYLLFSEYCPIGHGDTASGQWRFVLESVDGARRFEAADEERQSPRDRLELLAVVRGLEALDQPSKVTLVTPSRYVSRGLRYGLHAWRESNWLWERYGKMAPVKNSDLWRRVARALEFHEVECRTWRFDPPVGRGEERVASDEWRVVGKKRAAKRRVVARKIHEKPAPKKRLAAWFEKLLPERSTSPCEA